MREIKFRAWDKKRNRWYDYDVYGIYFDIAMNKILELAPDYDAEFEDCDSVELMQYTGLTDKNGKEIYEGDIVKETDVIKKFKGNFEVQWSNHELTWILKNRQLEWGSLMQTMITPEVIGNVHENQELLK